MRAGVATLICVEEGEELGGYRLIRRLGTGGAGTVWLAEDGGGERVALKALHPAAASSGAARVRLERETRTVNSVRSPFVAHIVDVETEANQPFVVSEYVDGPTLAELLASGPIPLRGVAALSYHLASTIAAVHHADIIHRDIKPSNIMCSPRGPVLIDFGIAMAVEDQHLTRTGLVSGTSGYTAPELLEGHGASKESDWWAWCATLLSCATGRPPFGKGDVGPTMLRVLDGEADVAGLRPDVAEALRAGLAPNPDERPSPSLIVADLMSAVGWAPGELDYASVNWAQLLDTGARTQALSSDLQEIAAPPQWDEATSRPDAVGAREVSYPTYPRRDPSEFTAANDYTDQVDPDEVAWHDDATDVWQAVETESDTLTIHPIYENMGAHQWPEDAQGGATESTDEENALEWSETESGEEPHPKRAWISSLTLLGLLALFPLVAGLRGTLTVGVVLSACALAGALSRWVRRRRRGRGVRASDGAAALFMSPLLLVRSMACLVGGIALGAIIPYLVWVVASWNVEETPLWGWPFTVMSSDAPLSVGEEWLRDPGGAAFVWALVFVVLVAAWLMPFTGDLREGLSVAVMRLASPLWARCLLIFACVAVVFGAWVSVTGGMLN